MIRFLLIALLAFIARGQASITAAWKVPIERVAPDHENNDKVRKLEKPPGESAFFQAGDELWDVSKCLHGRPANQEDDNEGDPFTESAPIEWKGDWIVWNARSGMFVARGSWNDLRLAEDGVLFADTPLILRTKLEVVRPDGLDARTLSVASRTGEKASAKLDGLEVEWEGFGDIQSTAFHSRYFISWPSGADGERWKVTTGLTLKEGSRLRLARQGQGDDSWEIFATVSLETIDGAPFGEARLLETPKGFEPWKDLGRRGGIVRKTLDPQRELGIYPASWNDVAQLGGEKNASKISDVNPPEELSEWVPGPLIDIKELLEESGMKFAPTGHFAGFDPRSQKAFVVTDSTNQDLAEQIFSLMCVLPSPAQIWVESNPPSGGWGLIATSGEKAAISRGSDKMDGLIFEIEPTSSGDGSLFDLRYKFDVIDETKPLGRLEAATTLSSGNPGLLSTYSRKEREDLKVTITATLSPD